MTDSFAPSVPTLDATPWAWRSGIRPWRSLPPALLALPADEVARALLGQRIRSELGGRPTEGVIVETEAYTGPHDPASHAWERIGRTPRNDVMFGRPGLAYVYLVYGVHWCLNVVTGREGFPAAVLIRALDPVEGPDVMEARRGRTDELASGPARLCQALGVTGALNGHDLTRPPLQLLPGWDIDPGQIDVSGRVGVTRARDWPLRFLLRAHPTVSS